MGHDRNHSGCTIDIPLLCADVVVFDSLLPLEASGTPSGQAGGSIALKSQSACFPMCRRLLMSYCTPLANMHPTSTLRVNVRIALSCVTVVVVDGFVVFVSVCCLCCCLMLLLMLSLVLLLLLVLLSLLSLFVVVVVVGVCCRCCC